MTRSTMSFLAAMLLVAGAVHAGSAPSATAAPQQWQVRSSASSKPAELPSDSVYQLPMQLTDQHGRRFDWTSRRGQPQLVGMFYTSCRYICPLIIESGKAIDHALTPEQRARLGVMLVSFDARRDTPERLLAVVEERHVDPRWILATPAADDVRSVAGVLDVQYRQLSDGEFNHSSALVLLDASGRIVARSEKMGSKPDPAFVAAVQSLL